MFKVVVLFSIVALSGALHGGYETVDPNDEDVVTLANDAANGLSKKLNGKFYYKLAKVLNARKQITDGANFIINVIVGETSCTRDEYTYENIDECDFQTGISHFLSCGVVVFRNAEGEHRLVASGCSQAKKDEVEGI